MSSPTWPNAYRTYCRHCERAVVLHGPSGLNVRWIRCAECGTAIPRENGGGEPVDPEVAAGGE